jgi:hypothetical protein
MYLRESCMTGLKIRENRIGIRDNKAKKTGNIKS